jgi:hypothetical protein
MGGLNIEHKHSLPADDAKARVHALGDYLQNRHGIGVTWDPSGEQAKVHGKYLVVDIEGAVRFAPGVVLFEGKDPGFLWRGKATKYLAEKLQKYLNPDTPLDSLPRK